MLIDLSQAMLHATVQLEQPIGDGKRRVGAGFLISAPTPDGRPRTILITANHVFGAMPGATATVGYRTVKFDGSWAYAPLPLKIRDAAGHELWTHHPSRDVAAIAVTAPDAFARAAIPVDYLATDETFPKYQVGPGDEMMALGFPRGYASNAAGFPILRVGRVASYPVAPVKQYPTFLLDFAAFPGNSGGPVFISGPANRHATGPGRPAQDVEVIAGILTDQIEPDGEKLGIGLVLHAKFIRETIARVSDPAAPATETPPAAPAEKTAAAEQAPKPE